MAKSKKQRDREEEESVPTFPVEPEPLDLENLPSAEDIVRHGVAAMWREIKRLSNKAETQMMSIQEQKLFGNYIEFFMKVRASGLLDGKLVDGLTKAQEDVQNMSPAELAALTVQAAKKMSINVDLAQGIVSTGDM